MRNRDHIWPKYLTFLVPLMLVLLTIMISIVYSIVSNSIKDNSKTMAFQAVESQSQNISNIFYRYIDVLNVLKQDLDVNNVEKFIDKVNSSIYTSANDWAYFRVTLPDGRTWTNIHGLDTINTKIRKYYNEIFLQNKNISFRMSHHTDVTKEDVFSVSVPLRDENGKVLAALTATFPTSIIDNILNNIKINGGGMSAIMDDELNIRMYYPNIHNTTANEIEEQGLVGSYKICMTARDMTGRHMYGKYYAREFNNIAISTYISRIPNTPWVVMVAVPDIQMNATTYLMMGVLITLGIIIFAGVLLILRFTTKRNVLQPLELVNKFANDVSQGKLYSTAAQSVNNNQELVTLRNSLESMQAKLIEIVQNIRKCTQDFVHSSQDWTKSIQAINDDAQTQSTAVEEISSSIDQIADSIKAINEKTMKTKENSENIANDIKNVTEASENTLRGIESVIEKVKVIDEISNRTDLLAINAAVEASRAGEEGKGFAVVAAEIRKLAEHCKQASAEINETSAESLNTTKNAVELIDKTSPRIQSTAEKIAEISEACSEQLSMTMSISRAIMQLVDITSNNTQTTDEMNDYAEKLKSQIDLLNQSVDFFKVKSDDYFSKREDIISEIEEHTTEILKLKTQLVDTVGESSKAIEELNNEAYGAIDEAISATGYEEKVQEQEEVTELSDEELAAKKKAEEEAEERRINSILKQSLSEVKESDDISDDDFDGFVMFSDTQNSDGANNSQPDYGNNGNEASAQPNNNEGTEEPEETKPINNGRKPGINLDMGLDTGFESF